MSADEILEPLDLSNLLRHAFLAGCGYTSKGIQRIDAWDQKRWVNYDPSHLPEYERIAAIIAKAEGSNA